MAAFASIGILASSLTANQIVAFLLGVVGCFAAYFGLQGLAESGSATSVLGLQNLGMQWRYEDMGRGVGLRVLKFVLDNAGSVGLGDGL